MKKKLFCMSLAITLSLMGSIVYGEEQKENKDLDENNLQILQQSTEERQVEQEGLTIKGDEFILKIDSKNYTMNGTSYLLAAAPFSMNGRTYVPLRFIVDQVLGAQFNWDVNHQEGMIATEKVALKLKVGSHVVYVNGEQVSIDAGPVVKKGTTYIPLKIVSDYFGCTVSYDAINKKIILTGKDKGINNKPIADFNFSQNTYIAGQIVKAASLSYDSDGHDLVDKEWCVEKDDSIVTHQELEAILKKPESGLYRIGLRVKDQHGLWSDWTYKALTILPNEAPKITYLGSERNRYAQGEEIKYQYFYENENWEEITNQRWTYRHEEEDPSKAILGKPDVLFTEGTYIITLELDDAYGNRSEIYETKVHITEEVLSKELTYRFTQGKIGDMIDNYQQFNYRNYEDAKIITQSTTSGSMIMSDSPEEVLREGILYRDAINGQGRILIHHINKMSDISAVRGNKRLVVVAENTSSEPVTLTLNNKTIKGPVSDVLFLGQKLLYDYLSGSQEEEISLQPGERYYVYDSGTKWEKETCISGLMDVMTTGEVTFTIAAVSSGNSIYQMANMEVFLPAVHPRGTFEDIAIHYTLHLDKTQPTKLLLGTGEEEWVKGYDALTHEFAQNKGNYGVSYYITITAEEDMGILLNPRANVFRGAIKWEGMGVYNIPGTGAIFSNTAKAVCLGTIKAGETKTFEYMLPNGSSAPVLIGFIPKSYWDH